MKKYIGCKMVEAEPCVKVKGKLYDCEPDMVLTSEEIAEVQHGYKVRYEDGYESFSPKDVFEKAYMRVEDNNTITAPDVEAFIKEVYVTTIGEKTTLVKTTLVNGFIICETSSCVDPANYDEEVGAQICMEKIIGKIWELLGFLLQTAIVGVKPQNISVVREKDKDND